MIYYFINLFGIIEKKTSRLTFVFMKLKILIIFFNILESNEIYKLYKAKWTTLNVHQIRVVHIRSSHNIHYSSLNYDKVNIPQSL